MSVSINGWVVGATKKPPEIAMKHEIKRILTFAYHLKPTLIMLKRKRIFIAIHNHLSNSNVDVT